MAPAAALQRNFEQLDDRWRVETGPVFLTGVQALARLPMLQRELDRAAGLNTSGFVTGYRGSPLATLDATLHEVREHLAAHDVRFVPAVNEDLGATSVWGTQQLPLFGPAKRDGIFALWYGKGPGVDRCVDVFKHANHAGTSQHGGVLVVAGDDHAARSSAVAHQSEHVFSACGIPVLAPAGVQDIVDFGLAGWALSRYAGIWVALKLAADIVEGAAVVTLPPAAALRSPHHATSACRRRPAHPLARPAASRTNTACRRGRSTPRWPGRAPTASTASSSMRRRQSWA
ncbi:MAG: hypothetical protein U1F67_23480 [Rubrivivax sp.]